MNIVIELNKKLGIAEDEIERLRDEINKLKRRIAELEIELEKARNKPPEIIEKIVEKEIYIEADNSELERLRAENEELKAEIKRLKAEIKRLQETISELEAKIAELTKEIARLNDLLSRKTIQPMAEEVVVQREEGPDNSDLWKQKKWLEDEIARLRRVLEDLLKQIAAAKGQLVQKKKEEKSAAEEAAFEAAKEEIMKKGGVVDLELPLDWDNVFVRLFNDSRQRLARLEARRGANWTKDAEALLRTFRSLFRTAAKLGPRAQLENDEGDHVLSLSQVRDDLGADWAVDKSFERTGSFK